MPKSKHARVLVTGSSGLVGGAVAELLGDTVELILPSRSDMDLLDVASVRSYLKETCPDVCIHAAALVMGLGGNISKPGESLHHNALMDLNLFSALRVSSVQRLLYVSTVAAYGFPYLRMPLVEADFFMGAPHEGEYGYASAKRLGHAHAEALFKTSGVWTSYLVLTNVFGPNDRFNMQTGHVIPSLILKAAVAAENQEYLKVWGNPSTTRDFVFSEDVARAIQGLIPLKHHGIVNISSGKPVEMAQIADIICREFEIRGIDWQSDRPVGIQHRVVSNQGLRELIDFEPQDFDESLTQTIQWYKSNTERRRT
jgi:GDP-L-fucose synthase